MFRGRGSARYFDSTSFRHSCFLVPSTGFKVHALSQHAMRLCTPYLALESHGHYTEYTGTDEETDEPAMRVGRSMSRVDS
jgi:hypothetical protein